MTKLERARELRADTTRHYNCCQSVVLPFAEELGLDEEAVLKLAEHFGSGMRRGSVCGAVTGGLMALGLIGDYVGKIYTEVKHRPRYILETSLDKPAGASGGGRGQGINRQTQQTNNEEKA